MKDSRTVIEGRYEVERTLGEGAFSTTYLALDRQTSRQCVVKAISPTSAQSFKNWQLFERAEADR